MISPPKTLTGVLCIPLPSQVLSEADIAELEALKTWARAAAVDGGIELAAIEGAFDSAEDIVARIFRRIQEADIIVSIIHHGSPNVMFESGYAIGWGKPILYLAKETDSIPFDIGHVERFIYGVFDDSSKRSLTTAMLQCLTAQAGRLNSEPDVVQLRRHISSMVAGTNLYGRCVRHTLARLSKWICNWKADGDFEFVGSYDVLEIGTFILDNLQKAGFATQYYSGQDSWRYDADARPSDEYFKATRRAVKRGCKITRVLVLDNESQIDEPAFRGSAWADTAGDIEVRYVLKSQVPDPKASDFGLWDDELFAEVDYIYRKGAAPQLHRCRYSSNYVNIEQAKAWKEHILELSEPCPDLPREHILLSESVKSFKAKSVHYEHFCHSNVLGKRDCSSYHLSWQHLRLCGMVSSPAWHGPFYTRALRSWSEHVEREGRRTYNVLVCGFADYAMLYWVAQSVGHQVRKRCNFHVLDICQTPIESCKWLVRRLQHCIPPMELSIHYHHADIFHNNLVSGTIDLIVSDAFLTRFRTVELKARLIGQWLKLTAANGTIITTARIQEGATDITDSDRQNFVARAVERAAQLGLDVDEVREIATKYSNYIESYPFPTEQSLRDVINQFEDQIHSKSFQFELLQESEMVDAYYGQIELKCN